MIKREVHIEGYTSSGLMIVQQTFTTHDWYEQLHPLIDSDEERKQIGVTEIRGRQYDRNGDLSVEWQTFYADNGSIRQLTEHRGDGTSSIRKWKEDGSMEHVEFS